MIEINVTDFVTKAYHPSYSASAAELGEEAGTITWKNAVECEYVMLKTEEELTAMREYLEPFGAWDEEEIVGFTDTELNALLIQFISSEGREGSENSLFKTEEGEYYFGLYH